MNSRNQSIRSIKGCFPWLAEPEISTEELRSWEDLRTLINMGIAVGAIPESELEGLFLLLPAMFEAGMRSDVERMAAELTIRIQDVGEA